MKKDLNNNILFGDPNRLVINPEKYIKDEYYLSFLRNGISLVDLTQKIIDYEIILIKKQSRIPLSYASCLINRWFNLNAITWDSNREGILTLTKII